MVNVLGQNLTVNISHAGEQMFIQRLNHSQRGQLRVSSSDREVMQDKRAAGFNTTWSVVSWEPLVMSKPHEIITYISHVLKCLKFC